MEGFVVTGAAVRLATCAHVARKQIAALATDMHIRLRKNGLSRPQRGRFLTNGFSAYWMHANAQANRPMPQKDTQ